MSEIQFCKQAKDNIGITPKFISRDHKLEIKHILIGWHKIFPLCMSPSGLYIMYFVPIAVAQKLANT